MKNFRPFTKREPESDATCLGEVRSENTSASGGALKTFSQTLPGSRALTENQRAADRIRIYCLHILFLILTCHAVFGEIKNGYKKNILASRESLKVLRTSLLEDRNMTPTQRRKVQLR